jgi:hypothetical protein
MPQSLVVLILLSAPAGTGAALSVQRRYAAAPANLSCLVTGELMSAKVATAAKTWQSYDEALGRDKDDG